MCKPIGTAIAFFAAHLSAVGCTQTDVQRESVSTAVPVTSNSAEDVAGAARWHAAESPALEIGVTAGDPAYQFHRLSDAHRFADSTILVANSGSSELRLFDSNGAFVASTGGQGGGPGEFAEFSSMRICQLAGDTVVVEDGWAGRIHLFVKQTYRSTERIAAAPDANRPSVHGCFANGHVFTTASVGSLQGPPGTVTASELRYYVASFDGTTELVTSATSRKRWVNQVGDVIHYPFIPFAPDPVATNGPDAVYLIRGPDPTLEKYDVSGRHLASITWEPPARTRSREVYDRYKKESLASIRQDNQRVRYARLYAQDLPIPEFLPVAQAILYAGDGSVWVERYRLDWETDATWDVFGPDGRIMATAATPTDVEIFQIGSDFLLGRSRDELGVERVVLYPLIRGSSDRM